MNTKAYQSKRKPYMVLSDNCSAKNMFVSQKNFFLYTGIITKHGLPKFYKMDTLLIGIPKELRILHM